MINREFTPLMLYPYVKYGCHNGWKMTGVRKNNRSCFISLYWCGNGAADVPSEHRWLYVMRFPANRSLRPNAGLILGHCVRRWTSAWWARHVSWDDRCKESHWGGCYKRLTVICCPHQFINVSQYTLLSFWSTTVIIPANTIHWTNVLMLGQRRERWPNIKPALLL